MKHVGTLETLPGRLRAEAFERLFRACEIAKFNPEKKLRYEKEMITERDYINILETAREDGFEAGLAAGEIKVEETRRTIAKAMLDSGMTADQILSLTGVSPDEMGKL